jgi:hypothetical protein
MPESEPKAGWYPDPSDASRRRYWDGQTWGPTAPTDQPPPPPHTFTYTRKHEAIARDPRVSYTIAAIPPDGFYGRGQLRAIQVEGIASFVTEPAEIQRAIEVSREQFEWMKDLSLFDTFDKGTAHHQTFIRIDPVEALWNDNRVRLLWRKIVTFTPDGRHVAALSPYETKLRSATSADSDGSPAS